MTEDLQSLLEKINREGVEKARAEASAITEAARKEAAKLVSDAKAEAEALKAAAEKSANESAERAAETIRQAARDTVLEVEDAVTKLLTRLLAENVEKALGDGETLAKLAKGAVEEFVSTGDVEVSASAKLVSSLKAALAAQKNVTVTMDEALGKGFTVKLDGGRVEHAFTADVVANELSRRLRPELAALVKGTK